MASPFDGHPEIVKWPDPSLSEPSSAVDPSDPSLPELADRLLRIMSETGGAGLAAVQIGSGKRVAAFASSVLPEGMGGLRHRKPRRHPRRRGAA